MSDLNEIFKISNKESDSRFSVNNIASNNNKGSNYIINDIGKALIITGKVIIGLGIFLGLIVGFTLTTYSGRYGSDPHPLRWVYALIIIGSSFVSGLFSLGFAEIIILLDKIKQNTSK